MGFLPDLGLIGADPVGFGLLLKVGNRLCQTGHFENESPGTTDRSLSVSFALIEPHHCRPQGPAVFIDIHNATALGGQRNAGNPISIGVGTLPQSLTGLNQGLPEDFRILLRPRRLLRIIRNKHHNFFGQ